MTDIFAIQDEIAGAIVAALKLRLLPGEKNSIERRGTTDLIAYDLYLRGTRPAFGADEQRARIELLESATLLAPDYANAWGALASARATWRLELPYAERGEVAVAVLQEALRALALDPRNVDALAAQVLLLPPFGRYLEAEALTERMSAIACETGGAHAAYVCNLWRARHYVTVGRLRETVDASRRAFEIDPLDPIVTNLWGRNLTFAGRFEEGKRILVDLLARWPDNHYAAMSLFSASAATEDWTTADALLDAGRLAKHPLREFEAWCRWYAFVMREPPPRARELTIRAVRKRFHEAGIADFLQLQVAAKVGAVDEAHEIALRANFGPPGTRGDRMGIDAYKTLTLFNVAFPEFRRDPRFVHLCARCGLVDYWMTTQRWPDCVDEVAPYYDFRRECEAIAAGPPVVRADRVA
jgi:tetratricopeptide (TPR) repeat protein